MADASHKRPALRFSALDVRRFLGLQRPGQAVHFPVGMLSPAVTLIAGPNASGKTTVARAVEAVLWPEACRDPLADVTAVLEADGVQWTAELAGTTRRWTRNGMLVTGPSCCAPADRDRYRLALHELLSTDDRELAAGIRRELGGGYSLTDAVQTLGFTADPGVPRKSVQRLRQALEAVATASREQADLRRREAELAGLRLQETAAREAADQLKATTCLLQWRAAGRRLVMARRQLSSYDLRIASLRGKEYEQLRTLLRAQSQSEVACARAAEALTTAETALTARTLGRALPAPEVLSRCRTVCQQAQQAEADVRRARADLDAVQAREQAARATLGDRLSPEHLASLDRLQPDARLADAVRGASEAAIAIGVMEHFRGLPVLGEKAADPATLETCRHAMEVLRSWLQEGPPAGRDSEAQRRGRTPLLVAALGALLSAGLAAFHWVLLVPAVIFGVLAWCLRPRHAEPLPASRRPELEAEFAGLGLPPPVAWTTEAVARRLEDLARQWSWDSARNRLLSDGLAVRTVLEKEAADRARALDACRTDLTAQVGCDLDGAPLAVFHLVTRIAAWQDARDAWTEAERRAASSASALATLLAQLGADLSAGGVEPPTDAAAAAAALELLEQEQAQRAAAIRERDRLAQELAAERRSLADLAERRRDLLQACGLRPDEEERAEEILRQWTALRAEVAAALAAVRAAETDVERCRAEAHRAKARCRVFQSLRTPHLTQRHEAFEHAAREREQLVRDIESTETLVREAKRRHDLEQRLAERDAAMAELIRERAAGWSAIAGQCCADLVAARLELQSSGVLRRAQQLLATITHGRYRLLADEVGGAAVFRARDTETDQVHDLTSLSSGTRVQVLLAARLAYIAEKEGDGPLLPLVLDEVLGNSDDERAGTIIDAVTAAACQGRQILCMTAQADEVGKWQSRLQRAGVPFTVCWLPQGAAAPPAVALTPVPPPAVPPPRDGETALDYAQRLGVPALDLYETVAGALHLWYLVDDLQALHALLRAGYRTWGALSLFLSQAGAATTLGAATPALAALDPRRLAARADLVMLVLTLLRVGRGRPLGRAGLLASGTVTDRYTDDVAQLLESVHGDARELVQRLEAGDIRGFRRRSLDELAQWLREHGHIDDRPPLTIDEIRARLHAGAAPHLASGALSMDDIRGLLRLAESLAAAPPLHPAEDTSLAREPSTVKAAP